MTRGYASETTVAAEQTRLEIERLLMRYGADGFYYGTDKEVAVLGFRMRERMIKFRVPMPEWNAFAKGPTGRVRTQRQWETAYEQAKRTRWRALLLIIRAKLEAVEDPFVGSGTTAMVARDLGRKAVGIDLSAEYLALAVERIGGQIALCVL